MTLYKMKFVLISTFLLLIAGTADAKAFLHASRVWQNGNLVSEELIKSSLSFLCSISMYIFTLKYVQKAGIVSAELQVIIWLSITLIGVGIMSGKFFQWERLDQLIAVLIVVGIGFLMIRTQN